VLYMTNAVAGGRDDVEGEAEALSFRVVRLRRSLLRARTDGQCSPRYCMRSNSRDEAQECV